jgi:hypothetical protein
VRVNECKLAASQVEMERSSTRGLATYMSDLVVRVRDTHVII